MREPQETDDRLDAVQVALAHLRPAYREAVTLRYIAGLSVDEVASALDISLATAKKRLVRALAHLRQRMEDQGYATSLWLAAALLQKLREDPPVGLAGRISDSILSGSSAQLPQQRLRIPKLPAPAALGATAALAGICIVAAALMPRVQRPPPTALATAPSSGSPRASQPGTLEERIGRRIPDYYDHSTSLKDTLLAVSQMSGIPIDPQWDSIEASGISRNTPVQIELHNMSARQQLDAILQQVAPGKLEYVLSGDHIVVRARSVGEHGGQAAALDHG